MPHNPAATATAATPIVAGWIDRIVRASPLAFGTTWDSG
jgi:hypothetical protein